VIAIRRARPGDAGAIAGVHVAAWRATYATVLPDGYLSGMSATRQALGWRSSLNHGPPGHAVFVAVAGGSDAPPSRPAPSVIGFASGGRLRGGARDEGEVEMLYLLDDYRDQGLGRRLMRAMAAHLNAIGCHSVTAWVLRDNPARWFYARLGGRLVMEQDIRVGGAPVTQVAMRWEPIGALLASTAPSREA